MSEEPRILVVDDDVELVAAMTRGLTSEGFAVVGSFDGADALGLLETERFDAVVLDLMLPVVNGFRVCDVLRGRGDATPVLVLTAKQGEWDEAEALETGADDYLKKPFSFVVLVAHLRALLRRRGRSAVAPQSAGDLRLDTLRHRCWRGDVEIHLTPREFAVLDLLFGHLGEPVSKRELLDEVWDWAIGESSNLVEVYIGYLRRKVDTPFGRNAIQTVRGSGYRLDADGG
jgi:two-component system OmpR family response regulator